MKTLTTVSTLSAVLAAACLFAGSASAQGARVAYGDLNLSTEAGKAELDARIDAAARNFCRQSTGSRMSGGCRQVYREEVLLQLSRSTTNPDVAQYASARLPARTAPAA